jgi:L-ribulose-5-phosphate 4-epimerase
VKITLVPVTAPLSKAEIESAYEANTGEAIIRRLAGIDPLDCPAALVAGHGPFTWGTSAADAAHNAAIVEELAAMALMTLSIAPETMALPSTLHDKHFFRKHGATAYYGQKK